jgi:hypothetical protein
MPPLHTVAAESVHIESACRREGIGGGEEREQRAARKQPRRRRGDTGAGSSQVTGRRRAAYCACHLRARVVAWRTGEKQMRRERLRVEADEQQQRSREGRRLESRDRPAYEPSPTHALGSSDVFSQNMETSPVKVASALGLAELPTK